MRSACRLPLMCLSLMVLACSCSGPCPPGTWARFEKPLVLFEPRAPGQQAGYHVAWQSNKVMTVYFTGLQAELRPFQDKGALQASSYARLAFDVHTWLKKPFYATVRVDFRYSAALSKGCQGHIHAWMNESSMWVAPDLRRGRYDEGTRSFEFTHVFKPGDRGDLWLRLHVLRGSSREEARMALNSMDVQLLVPTRMARRITHNTRTR